MSVQLLFRKLVFAQVLLSLMAFCFAEQRPELLLAAGALCALSWYVVEGPNGRPLPAWIIMTGAIIASLWLLSSLYFHNTNIIVAVGHFTIWLQILLLYGPKTNREYGEILALSLLTMMGASLLTVSLLFGLLLTAYCILGLFSLLVFYLKNSNDHVTEAHRAAAPRDEDVHRPAAVVGRNHRRHFQAVAVAVGLACIVIASMVFLLFPRTNQTEWQVANLNPFQRTRAGFSGRVDLTGPAPSTSGTRTAVMHLTAERQGRTIKGGDESFLLRGAALDQYDPGSRVWSRTIADYGETYTPLTEGAATLDPAAQSEPSMAVRIVLRHPSTSTLFSIYPTSRIESDDFDAISLHPVDQQLQISGQPPEGTVTYTVRTPLDPSVVEPAPDTERRVFTRARGVDGAPSLAIEPYASTWTVDVQRIRAHTLGVIRRQGLERDPDAETDANDLRIADAIAGYLREQYRYTLHNPSPPHGRDPITAFIFESRQGHCELFAAAMVAMTRSIGIRSRVVTGYHVSEYNRVGGYYVVRENDAHAWTEVRDATGRWHTFDATAPEAVASEHRADQSLLGMVRELYEHLEYAWIDSFAAFNAESRGNVLQRGVRSVRDAGDRAMQAAKSWVGWWRDWRWHATLDWLDFVLVGGVLTVLVGGGAAWLRTRRRRRYHARVLGLNGQSSDEQRQLLDALGFYVRTVDLLCAHGHDRPTWQTPGAFVQSLHIQLPHAAAPAEELTRLYYELRYGGRPHDDDRRRRAAAALANLETALQSPA